MQALHALALSNVELCIPVENSIRFVACLAPYLKVDSTNQPGQQKSEREAQYEAEQLVCVLAVTSAVLQQVESINLSLARDLETDLMKLIRMHTFQSVSPHPLLLHVVHSVYVYCNPCSML